MYKIKTFHWKTRQEAEKIIPLDCAHYNGELNKWEYFNLGSVLMEIKFLKYTILSQNEGTCTK